MSVIEVSSSTFQAEVIERSRTVPVVVDFWAPWCGPCRALGPVLERLAAASGGAWVLAKLNTDDNQGIAKRYNISSIPAVKAFRDGQVVDEFVGALPEPRVREFLGRVVPDEAALAASRAKAALAAGDQAGAGTLFAEALRKDAAQPDALLYQARAALAAGDKAGAKAALAALRPRDREQRAGEIAGVEFGLDAPALGEARAAVAAAPTDSAALYGLGCALVAAGEAGEALETFLTLVKRDRKYGDDAGRKAMLRVFDLVGVRSPLADDFRRRLSMELFK